MSWLSKGLSDVYLGGISNLWRNSGIQKLIENSAGQKSRKFLGYLGAAGGLVSGASALGAFGLGSGGAAASSGGLGSGLTEFGTGAGQTPLSALGGAETYSTPIIEATRASGTPSWGKALQMGGQAGFGQNSQQPPQRFEDPAIDAERRHQRVMELLAQLHQSQQPPMQPGVFQ